jgi:hypothetical protein
MPVPSTVAARYRTACNVVTDPGFMSTSTNFGQTDFFASDGKGNKSIRLAINVLPGSKSGILLPNSGEKEYLIDKGSKLLVLDADEVGGQLYVRALLLP